MKLWEGGVAVAQAEHWDEEQRIPCSRPNVGKNTGAVVGGGASTPAEQWQGTLEQGTKPAIAHPGLHNDVKAMIKQSTGTACSLFSSFTALL